jgi:hypothetical protein
MPFDRNPASTVTVNTAFFALSTLVAWTATTFLFVLLKRAPLTRGASLITNITLLSSLLPWLAACVFWIRVRKRAKLGTADSGTLHLSQKIITTTFLAAYVALINMEALLLWVMTRTSRT